MNSFLKRIREVYGLIAGAFALLMRHQPLQLAGATSFFAVFALPATILVLGSILSLFGGERAVLEGLFYQFSTAIDTKAISEVSKTVSRVEWLRLGSFMQLLVFIFLLFVATTFFSIVRSSMDQLWGIHPKKDGRVLSIIRQRAKSFAAILIAGIFLLVVMKIGGHHPEALTALVLAYIASAIWFSLVFRFLADGRPTWRASVLGGAFAALFFSIGKSLLRLLLPYANIRVFYGASAAIVLLLLFVFYCSLIFYFSACIVGKISGRAGTDIKPLR